MLSTNRRSSIEEQTVRGHVARPTRARDRARRSSPRSRRGSRSPPRRARHPAPRRARRPRRFHRPTSRQRCSPKLSPVAGLSARPTPGASASVNAGVRGRRLEATVIATCASIARTPSNASIGRYSTAASQRSKRIGWLATFNRNGTVSAFKRKVSARTRAGAPEAAMCQYTRTVCCEATTSDPVAPSTMKNPGDSAGSSFGSGTLTATPERIWPPSFDAAIDYGDPDTQPLPRDDRLVAVAAIDHPPGLPAAGSRVGGRERRRQLRIRADRLHSALVHWHCPPGGIERRIQLLTQGRDQMPTTLDSAQCVAHQSRQRSAGLTEPGVRGGAADRDGPDGRRELIPIAVHPRSPRSV